MGQCQLTQVQLCVDPYLRQASDASNLKFFDVTGVGNNALGMPSVPFRSQRPGIFSIIDFLIAWMRRKVSSADPLAASLHAAVILSRHPPGMPKRFHDLRALPKNSDS
ncbi:hypothetical protein E2C01_023247 [Portunus trituberculatus]|uniref:Uncharacterized protein n=1 Tax=Portunus trituberculatus TaxID=210409 RepID=A0A5B7EAM5_PORTR|nr:hypothetical protein [Portunus trituberculatus]